MILLHNARLIKAHEIVNAGCLLIDGSRIAYSGPSATAPRVVVETKIDLKGHLVGPGLIDVHCHGGGSANAFENPIAFMEYHLQGGTTTVLPTLGYNIMHPGTIGSKLSAFRNQSKNAKCNTHGGFHLEGPYMNPRYGAGSVEAPMRNPDPAEYENLIENFGSEIKLWTFAPELPGTDAFIARAVAAEIILSVGHTEATADRLLEVANAGVSQACHALNATGLMPKAPNSGIRQPGIDEAIMVCDAIHAEVIPDRKGVHVHPIFLNILLRTKGVNRISIITDCTHDKGRQTREEGDDVHYNHLNQLSGSRLQMIDAVRNMISHTHCTLPEAFRMGSLNPARSLGRSHELGSLDSGKTANLLVMDDQLNIQKIFFEGQLC